MLMPHTPTSNAERQRQFLQRHPGYYRKYNARRRAAARWALQNASAMDAAMVAEAEAKAQKREPLMLPAPVETIEIPGMTRIEVAPAR